MAIKFACPACKSVVQVDDAMAGKTGKCKCGKAIRIPAPNRAANAAGTPAQAQSRPAAVPSNALTNVFDDLTEADYNRTNPYHNVYAPPKSHGNDSKALGSAAADKAPKTTPGVLTGTLILISTLNLLGGLVAIGLAVLVMLASSVVGQALEAFPIAAAGMALLVVYLVGIGLFQSAGAIGVYCKQAWGWWMLATCSAANVCDRLMTLGLTVFTAPAQPQIIRDVVAAVVAGLVCGYMFKDTTRNIFRLKSTLPVASAAIVGVLITLTLFGIFFAVGMGEESV